MTAPTPTEVGIAAADVLTEARRRYGDDLDAEKLGVTYEAMLTEQQRLAGGVYYTPDPVALFMARFSLDIALQRIGTPGDLLRLVDVIDPACGAGVFLEHGARQLAVAYAQRLEGHEAAPDPVMVDAALREVIPACIFGIDIDPVAVDLARISLSLLTGGLITPEDLTENIICGNPLDGPDVEPPALRRRREAS